MSERQINVFILLLYITMSIEERLNVLNEFAEFYKAQTVSFCFPKWVALFSLEQTLELVKKEEGELTEERIDKFLEETIGLLDTDKLAKKYNMSDLDKAFFEGGFGLGIAVLKGDEETINRHREMMKEVDGLGIQSFPEIKEENDKLLNDIMEDIKNINK